MTTATQGLSPGEVQRIMNNYIGVTSDGYLVGFSYAKLERFYPMYCDLEIDVWRYGKETTRVRFGLILQNVTPDVQAKILRGILEMSPEPTADVARKMTHDDIRRLVSRLEGLPVAAPQLENARDVVVRALKDAEALLERQNATSAIDRVHTALHGYLRGLCEDAGINLDGDPSAPRLLKLLRENYAGLQAQSHCAEEVFKVLTSMGTAIDALGTVRNTASVAHPNENLIDESDAMLLINFTRSIMHYLDAKLG